MKNIARLVAGLLPALLLLACSEQPASEPEAVATQPAESADEFVARMHGEFLDYAMEAEIGDWVYLTYINADTTYPVSAARERFTAWQAAAVRAALEYDGLLELWQGWRKISVPMREQYERFVGLTNQGAR